MKDPGEIICTEVLRIRTQTAVRGTNCSLRALNRTVVHYFLPSRTESHLMVEWSNAGCNAKLEEPSCYPQGHRELSVGISVICGLKKKDTHTHIQNYLCQNFVCASIRLNFYAT